MNKALYRSERDYRGDMAYLILYLTLDFVSIFLFSSTYWWAPILASATYAKEASSIAYAYMWLIAMLSFWIGITQTRFHLFCGPIVIIEIIIFTVKYAPAVQGTALWFVLVGIGVPILAFFIGAPLSWLYDVVSIKACNLARNRIGSLFSDEPFERDCSPSC